MNPNDEVRDAILRHLYAVHEKASSPRSAAIKISELQRAMKEAHGYKRNQIGGNLSYLMSTGHVAEVVENRTYATQGGTIQSSPAITYKITDKGVDRMERGSLFQRPATGQHINVTNINGVTTIGDHNVVNVRYADLSQELSDLRTQLVADVSLDEESKLNAAGDIDTILGQIQKTKPNAGLIREAWRGVEAIATSAGAVDAVHKIAHLVGHIT
jgi:hypothetical protein